MRKIRAVPSANYDGIKVCVYQGGRSKDENLIRITEMGQEVCLNATEAAALRNFLNAALGAKGVES